MSTTRVKNQVTVSAKTLDGSLTRTDVSDDGDDLDGNTQNDVTEVRLNFNPILEATKTVSMSSNANPVIGDIAEYTITVENKGNVDVSNLNLNDTFVGLAEIDTIKRWTNFHSATAGSSATTVKRDGTVTYTASFTVNQASVDSGGFRNTVVVTGSNPGVPLQM